MPRVESRDERNMSSAITRENQPKVGRLRGALRAFGLLVLGFVLLLLAVWATAALYFDVRVPWLRVPLATTYALGVLVSMVLLFVKRPWLAAGLSAGGFALVMAWWLNLK